jgi:chemotaxis methyl-accepting protein methylase
MLDQQHPGDFLRLTRKISVERGFGCASYKEKCLRRRIAVRMRARGVHTYEDYARILDADSTEYDRLLDALTINVTKLFRNWDAYASIAANVIPELWRRDTNEIRVWSAGCSSGDEPYSLAILFHQFAAAQGELSRISRVRILGTDIDRQCLTAAERAEFDEADFADTPEELRARYFSTTPPFAVVPSIRALVRFERRDLLNQPPPTERGRFDLVVCRNVLIYFDRETQERLFSAFHDAIAPGGFLVLGKVETLLGKARSLFAPVDARERVFRRV